MRKKLFIFTVVSLMVCLIGFVGFAYAWDDDHHGKSKHGHLYLYQKIVPTDPTTGAEVVCLDPSDPNVSYPYPCSPVNDLNWSIVRRGAWGKMEYKFWGPIFNFEFEGHRLEHGKSYTLIYYPDNWSPGSGLIYLGSDVADKHGNVHIGGSLDTGDLPAPYDENSLANPPGAKIWLVLSSDICFRGYYAPYIKNHENLDKYLFADDLIKFDSPENRDCY